MTVKFYDASGNLLISNVSILDDTAGGTDALVTKAPTSNVMYDHGVATTGVHSFDKSCRVYNNANISIANTAWTVVTLNSERWDTDGMHSIAATTSRLTCVTVGYYFCLFSGTFAASTTGERQCLLQLNGNGVVGAGTILATMVGAISPTGTTHVYLPTFYTFAAGDYIEAFVFQTSGGALNLDYNANVSPEFMMARIS